MVKINVFYYTSWGESLVLRQGTKTTPMEYAGAGLWKVEVPSIGPEYSYELHRDGVCIRKEWRTHHIAPSRKLTIYDRWNDRCGNSPFCSQFFTEVVFRRGKKSAAPASEGNLTLILQVPEVRPDQTVAIAGSSKELGAWKKFIPLSDAYAPEWRISLDVKEAFDYKFLIIDKAGKPVFWENGGNRRAETPVSPEVRFEDVSFPFTPFKGAGTAVPVFSLRTEESFGIGEFSDIKKLVDWAVLTGQNIIQLLPINDTTMTGKWQDSYPYNANSTFALHPQFIHLPAAGVRQDNAYKALRDELNALPAVDYERVNDTKAAMLRKVYASGGAALEQSEDYKAFRKANDHWLIPYAVFCCLRDSFGTPDFQNWGKYAKYTPAKASKYAKDHPEEVGFYCFEQYHLDAQLKDAVRYAHSKGVGLKGDLPIGISRTSVDAWAYPDLFHMDSQAGAPPDAFSADGQNWGFPTYNWEKMAEDGFAWWKDRMRKMSEYFDAFRIDHILGFFRHYVKQEYKHSDNILISSRSFEKSIAEYGDYKDKVIYYPQWSDGSDNGELSVERLESVQQVESSGVLKGGFKLMFAGAVGEAHGFECTMQAALLTKDHKDIKWIIVGDGRRLDWVKNYVKEHGLEETVFTLGRYPAETMPWFFKQADVMLVTLSDDPLFRLYAPAKISSYMAAAKPIVAVLNGEGAEVIKEAGCGWSLPAGDAEGFAKLAVELSQKEAAELAVKGENAAKYYNEHFVKEKCLRKLDELMNLK